MALEFLGWLVANTKHVKVANCLGICKRTVKRKSEIDAARSLHRAFREDTPRGTKKVSLQIPRAGIVMGKVDAIDYTTVRNGKSIPYRHTFQAGSKPVLMAVPRQGLLLLKGRFRVTGRGIVDLDVDGREIDD